MTRTLGAVVALLAGAVLGFFFVGALVMADGTMAERVSGLAIAVVVYFLLSAWAGWSLRTWAAGLWEIAVGAVVVLLFGDQLPVQALVLGGLLVSGIAGGITGSHLANRRR